MHESRGGTTAYIEWTGDDLKGTTCQPQDMIVWEGMELIGCPRGGGKDRCGIVQGVVYTITKMGDDVTLEMNEEYKNDPDPDSDDEAPDTDVARAPHEIKVPYHNIPKLLRLTHAMCYFTVQGRTLRNKRILLVDAEHRHFQRRSLIVGLSRATHASLVHVASAEDEERVTGRRRMNIGSSKWKE